MILFYRKHYAARRLGENKKMFFNFYKRKEKSKLERLYDKYSRIMYIEAYRILNDKALSEDAVSDAFARVINHLHKIDENDSHKTIGYLVTICKNVAFKLKDKSDKERLDEEIELHTYSKWETEKMVIEKESVEELKGLIKSLKPIYYDVLRLKYVDGLNNNEISVALGISEEAVRMRLSRAKSELKQKMERRKKDEEEL